MVSTCMNIVYILVGSTMPFIIVESSAFCSAVSEAAICADICAFCASVSRLFTSAPLWSCVSCSGVSTPIIMLFICSSDTMPIIADCI